MFFLVFIIQTFFMSPVAVQFTDSTSTTSKENVVSNTMVKYAKLSSTSAIIESNWAFKTAVYISPATSIPNYQVELNLDNNIFNYTRVKSDGSDIRFTNTTGTMLNYWIESWNNTGNSTVWINIPTSGTSLIYMYYANSSAISLSNGTATFPFFDDFLGTSLNPSVWTNETDQYSTLTVGNGVLTLTSHSPNDWTADGYPYGLTGFSDWRIKHGQTYAWVDSGAICYCGRNWQTFVDNSGVNPNATISPSTVIPLSTWTTVDIGIANSIYVTFSNSTNDWVVTGNKTIPSTPYQINLNMKTIYSGPGTGWGSMAYTKQVMGYPGTALRAKINDSAIPGVQGIIQYDWILIRNYTLADSKASLLGNLTPISINGDADFDSQAILNNWQGAGTASSPYLIQNNIIAGYTNSTLISVINTARYFKIKNNKLIGINGSSQIGIYLENVDHALVEDNYITNTSNGIYVNNIGTTSQIIKNTVKDNSGNGIYVYNSYFPHVLNNTVSNNKNIGIYIVYSNYSIIAGNIVSYSGTTGFDFYYSFHSVVDGNSISHNSNYGILNEWPSLNNTFSFNTVSFNSFAGISVSVPGLVESISLIQIANNEIYDNAHAGVYLNNVTNSFVTKNDIYNNQIGMWFQNSKLNEIENNTINSNLEDGLAFNSSSFSNVSLNLISNNNFGITINGSSSTINILGNEIKNNIYHGVAIENSSENTVMYNTFTNNNFGANQAFDDGINNNFDYNAWSDASTTDTNQDYISDIPYAIQGSANNYDNNPLYVPESQAIPLINSPQDINMYLNTSYTVMWTVKALRPANYSIYKNNVLITPATPLVSTSVNLTLFNTDLGRYNLTIVITDVLGRNVSATVWINGLLSNQTPSNPTTPNPTNTVNPINSNSEPASSSKNTIETSDYPFLDIFPYVLCIFIAISIRKKKKS